MTCEIWEETSYPSHKKAEDIEDRLKLCPVYAFQGRDHFAVRVKLYASVRAECVLSSTAVQLTQVQTLEERSAIHDDYRWQNLILLD